MSILLGLLAYIPGFIGLAQAITTKLFDYKVAIYQARTGAARDVAIAAVQAEVENNRTKVNWITALASNPVMLFIVVGFATPFILYEWQAIVWDKLIMKGATSTDPIRGQLADWAQIILTGIFVTSAGIGIAHTWVAKRD